MPAAPPPLMTVCAAAPVHDVTTLMPLTFNNGIAKAVTRAVVPTTEAVAVKSPSGSDVVPVLKSLDPVVVL